MRVKWEVLQICVRERPVETYKCQSLVLEEDLVWQVASLTSLCMCFTRMEEVRRKPLLSLWKNSRAVTEELPEKVNLASVRMPLRTDAFHFEQVQGQTIMISGGHPADDSISSPSSEMARKDSLSLNVEFVKVDVSRSRKGVVQGENNVQPQHKLLKIVLNVRIITEGC